MNQLQTFHFELNEVRVVMQDGEPWFVAKDVCDALDIGNVSLAVNGRERLREDGSRYWSGGLDEDEKGIVSVNTHGGVQGVLCVTEPGVYSLVFQSRKPEAKTFKRWVTHDVIPTIRKTGSYVSQPLSRLELIELARESELARLETEKRNAELHVQLQLQAPKVALYEVAMQAQNAQPIGTVAKSLGVGPNKLFAFLREHKILISVGSRYNLPYQEYIDRGYFEVRQYSITHYTNGIENKAQPMVTAKGMAFIHRLLEQQKTVRESIGV